MIDCIKFETRAPSPQTAVDVFRDRWASDLSPLLGVTGTGQNLLFTHDVRPRQAAQAFGREDFAGMDVLEIGPLEAAHTYYLEQMGAAHVTCVEASVEAYLKCLIIKEILPLSRSRFLLGDAVAYLEEVQRKFDLVFCSGVLYHMADPIRLIAQIAKSTDRCFVWSHIYDRDRHPTTFTSVKVERHGETFDYWTHSYGDRSSGFWGGNAPTAVWLTRDDLIRAIRVCGLSNVTIIEEQWEHPNGPAITLAASRNL